MQVTREAEPEVIEAAYKRLAFKYHPDRNYDTSAAATMCGLNEAYETLCDPQKRKQYDSERQLYTEQSLQQFNVYAANLLNQGLSVNDVINNFVQSGIDLETAANIVGYVDEVRRRSVKSQAPSRPSRLWAGLVAGWNSTWGWVAIGIIVGGLYFYNKSSDSINPKELSPIKEFAAGWDTGFFTHDFLITNQSGSDLSKAEVTVTLYRDDGKQIQVRQFWAIWKQNETKKLNVESNNYQKMELQGSAIRGVQKVRIDKLWN